MAKIMYFFEKYPGVLVLFVFVGIPIFIFGIVFFITKDLSKAGFSFISFPIIIIISLILMVDSL